MNSPLPTTAAPPQSPSFGVAPKVRAVSLDGTDWLSRLADRVNPLVIREIRQGLRTRIFWMSFAMMLIACVVTSLIAYGVHSENSLRPHGQEFFTTYFVILGLVHFLVLPFNAFRSLMKEREDETWVLLSLTGLGPRRILLGKVLSTLLQGVLYASALLPFVVFSYFLDGISLPSILIVLTMGFAHHAFLTVISVCLATLGDNRVFRAGAQLACVALLFTTFFSGVSGGGIIAASGSKFMMSKEGVAVSIGTLWNELLVAWVFLEAAASRLMLTSEDYTRRPRRAWLIALLVSVPVTWGLALWSGGDVELSLVLTSLAIGGMAVFGGVLVATDRDGCSRRHRRSSLLRPGALPGYRLANLVLIPMAALLLGVGSLMGTTDEAAITSGFGTALLYVVLFLAINVLLTRGMGSLNLDTPVAQRSTFFTLIAVASGLPPLIAVVLQVKPENAFFNIFNPLVGPFIIAEGIDDGGSDLAVAMTNLAVVGIVSALLVIAADKVLRGREKRANEELDGKLEAHAA